MSRLNTGCIISQEEGDAINDLLKTEWCKDLIKRLGLKLVPIDEPVILMLFDDMHHYGEGEDLRSVVINYLRSVAMWLEIEPDKS